MSSQNEFEKLQFGQITQLQVTKFKSKGALGSKSLRAWRFLKICY